MVEMPLGGFRQKKKGQSIEIQVQRSDHYDDFALKAAVALKLRFLPRSSLCLFKVTSGAVILDEDIVVNRMRRPWTLGNYLSLLKKGGHAVKIGVSYVVDPVRTDRSSSPDLPSSGIFSSENKPSSIGSIGSKRKNEGSTVIESVSTCMYDLRLL